MALEIGLRMATIVWFRHDLRLEDNPALVAAVARRSPVVPVFIWSPAEAGAWPAGAASRWWLHQSLLALDLGLRERGTQLIIRRGSSGEELQRLAHESGADAVLWNREIEPALVARDALVAAHLCRNRIECSDFPSRLLFDPREVHTQSGGPFRVFTPFWRHCLGRDQPLPPVAAPRHLYPPAAWPESLAVDDLALKPRNGWAGGLHDAWQPGEVGAAAELARFLDASLPEYAAERDRPDHNGTSRLSPHLHFGEISPAQVWHAALRRVRRSGRATDDDSAQPYLRQLVWREFAGHLLHHFPHTPLEPLRTEFSEFPWEVNETSLRAWQLGDTGYPLIDAGMRQLWDTGWMHNRVRMIAGSFLVKDLLQPWQEGARWFWDTLVDADLANNTLGWQWIAGCGADAAPFFRIFNPVAQGEKFDPHGDYVRRWVPELSQLPAEWIHKPWAAPGEVLGGAGVKLGVNYPAPIVEHQAARRRALAALARLK